jgi:hypothetical protein
MAVHIRLDRVCMAGLNSERVVLIAKRSVPPPRIWEEGDKMSGIFGFSGKGNAFVEVKEGLENLSHRGQESWGIVSGLKDGSFAEARRTGSLFQSPPLPRLHFGSSATSATRPPERRASVTRSP